jgi:hypothetical protein
MNLLHMSMTKEEATERAQEHLNLIGQKFHLPDGETETVKAVVAWRDKNGEWYPHVCFYEWDEAHPDGEISHMRVDEFIQLRHPSA